LTRGAWIAAANEPLAGVVALRPVLARETWLDLFSAQVNVLRPDARGFLPQSADTLSLDPDLRPINVRRLLILLRRLALREGSVFVFQSNNEFFRAFVMRRFETLLNLLYQRGAFAGARTETAYQVVVDERINTPERVERGQLIAELRVAPSRPLTFITVRLIQGADDHLRVSEGI
jgi:phage tail sheath protein FI